MARDNDIVLIDSDDEDSRSNKRFKLDTPDLLKFGSPFRNNLHTPIDTESVLTKASDKLSSLQNNASNKYQRHELEAEAEAEADAENENENQGGGDGDMENEKEGGAEAEAENENQGRGEGDMENDSQSNRQTGKYDVCDSGTSSDDDELVGYTSSRAPMEISLRAPVGTNLRLDEIDDDDDDGEEEEEEEDDDGAEGQQDTNGDFESDTSDHDDSSLDQVSIVDTPQFSAETILETRKYLRLNGNMKFLEKYLPTAASSEDIVKLIIQLGFVPKIHDSLNLMDLIQTLNRAMIKVKSIRNRLDNIVTVNDALDQIANCNKIMVITGAGISTSIGIPDFRSSQGFYSQVKHLGLNDPQEVFDLENFHIDPSLFYSIAHMIIPPEKIYSPLHAFIKLLQDKNKLLRNYTQNIDNLESYAGISPEKLIQCHGSFATATCITCGYQVSGESIFDRIRNKQIANCPKCAKSKQKLMKNEDNYVPESYGVFKPDITFFGESLPKLFHDQIVHDLDECDLLISIGTSLKVAPVADIVDKIPDHIPQLLINKDPINHCNFDVSLLGYCDDVASFIANRLGESWDIPHQDYNSIRGNHGDNLEMELIDEKYREYKITNLKTEVLRKQKQQQEAEKLKQQQESDNAKPDVSNASDSSLNDVNNNQKPTTTVDIDNQGERLLNNTTNVEILTPINS